MQLNTGEFRIVLARAVCFHRLGRLHDRTLESRRHRGRGFDLGAAVIIPWNTVCMERAVQFLRARGEEIPDGMLSYLAPLGWQPINLTGACIRAEPPRLDGYGGRPRRATPELAAARCSRFARLAWFPARSMPSPRFPASCQLRLRTSLGERPKRRLNAVAKLAGLL